MMGEPTPWSNICPKSKIIPLEHRLLLDTGPNLNVHKTLRRRPGCLLNVLRAFSLRPVFRGLSLTLTLNNCLPSGTPLDSFWLPFVHFNGFHATGEFLYHLKTENQRFSSAFMRYKGDQWDEMV